jgi:outer membrane receptor for ferrienterochelin and colicin
VNGTSAKVDGAEIVATLRPTRGFTTSVGFTYTDARLSGDTDPVAVGAVKGDRLPFTPKYAVNLNADYQWGLGASVTASIGGSIRSVSRQSGSFDPAYRAAYGRFARVDAYEVLDLRAGLDFGRYSLAAYANNVTNSGGVTSTQALLGVAGLPRNVNGALGTAVIRPRTIGINAAVAF